MNKHSLIILFLLASMASFGQCPLSVGITSVPDISSVPVCKSSPVVLTGVQSTGAISPVYYWIVDGDTILGVDSTITLLANSQNVSLIMSTSTGCTTDSAFTTIQILTVIMQTTVAIVNSSCDLTKADIQLSSTGGTSSYSYDLVGVGTSTTGSYTNVPAGGYTVYVTDAQGCNDTNQITVTPQPTVITSTPTPLPTECNQTTFDVITSTTGGTSPYNYDLQGVGQNSTGLFSNISSGDYTLITTDSKGCSDTSVVTIVPVVCPPPFPTEVITPNDDGINDQWIIYNIQYYPNNEVFIFDRWGQRVYHKKNYDNIDGWKAKYIGLNMPVSTYYYVLKVKFEKSDDQVYKGPISVFR